MNYASQSSGVANVNPKSLFEKCSFKEASSSFSSRLDNTFQTGSKPILILTGDNLTIAQVSALTQNQEVEVVFDECVESIVTRSRTFLDEHLESKVIYGVNTGFGPMASHLIGKENLTELQYNLIQSHAVGMGQPVPHSFVLAAMLVRLNTLTKGRSGVSFALLEQLRSAINH